VDSVKESATYRISIGKNRNQGGRKVDETILQLNQRYFSTGWCHVEETKCLKLSWSQVLGSTTFDGTFGMIRKMPRAEVRNGEG